MEFPTKQPVKVISSSVLPGKPLSRPRDGDSGGGGGREEEASTTTPNKTRPLRQLITLDLFVLILANSVFHPWIALIFYLSVCALHKHKEPIAFHTLYYTGVLMVVELAMWANHRVTYGRGRTVRWDDEVVVLSGGGAGLGKCVAEILVRKGCKVAVLDVVEADQQAREEMERWDLVWVRCDVGDETQVKAAVARIVKELGPPTILINNAASPINGLPLISADTPTLSSSQVLSTLKVNTVAHFALLHELLPHLTAATNGAHVVTISSILSHLAPARLSDYSASKSAISSLHHTLTHEIRSHPDPAIRANVKTLLVETGQLDTQLFAEKTRLPWYANFFGPVLDSSTVAKEIVRVVERGDGGVLRMPFYAKVLGAGWYNVLPGAVQLLMRRFAGIDAAIGSRE